MKKFQYNGPVTCLSLKGSAEVMLHTGEVYDLPDDKRAVRTLVAKGHLVEWVAPAAPAKVAASTEPTVRPSTDEKASKAKKGESQ